MNKFYLLLGAIAVAAACLYVGSIKLRSIPQVSKVDYASISPALDNTQPAAECQNKKTCLIIYVAPWCGACHMFIERNLPLVTKMISQKEMGLLIVVGADTPEKTTEQAKRLGALATTDTNSEFMKKNKVEYFPYFIVANSGQVTHHGRTALDWLNEKMNEELAH